MKLLAAVGRTNLIRMVASGLVFGAASIRTSIYSKSEKHDLLVCMRPVPAKNQLC